MNLRAPLGEVLRHGAAGTGSGHWLVQRLSALALIPLSIWLVVSLMGLPAADFDSLNAWVAHGVHPVLLSLTVLFAVWHSWLGVQVVIEDYVHGPAAKHATLLLVVTLHVLLVATGLFAVMRIALRSLP